MALKAVNCSCSTNPMLRREVCGGDFETTIKRSQWGMDWVWKASCPTDVRLVIQVEAIRQ